MRYRSSVPLTLVKHVTHSGPEVFFKTCVAMKFVDDDDDDDDDEVIAITSGRSFVLFGYFSEIETMFFDLRDS